MAVITTYNCTGLTGGATRDLDNISVAELADGDRAIVADGSNNFRYFEFQASATDAEDTASIPARVRPDDYSSAGVWYEQLSIALQKDGSVAITGDWDIDGANTLFVDKANGRVGMGTSTPGQKLEVHNASANAVFRLSTDTVVTAGFDFVLERTTNDVYFIQRENADMYFRTNNSANSQVILDSSGNVGIGQTPTAPLNVVGNVLTEGGQIKMQRDDNYTNLVMVCANAAYSPAIILERARGDLTTPAAVQSDDLIGSIQPRGYDGNSYKYSCSTVRIRATETHTTSAAGNKIEFATVANGATSDTVRMTIDQNGYVGVGLVPTANMPGLSIEAGVLTLKETTTPTADTNYGKIYTKSDNKLYFQDGAGVEHEVAFV